MPLGIDLAGFPNRAASQLAESAPQYELEGFALGQMIKSAAYVNKPIGLEYPEPELEHTARWMLSLYLWREFLFGNQKGALGGDSYTADASAFAYHTAEAFRILLRPWVNRQVKMRPRMLQRWANDLDRMVSEIVRVRLAQDNGDFSELAIWEIAGGEPQLIEHLVNVRDQLRECGLSEEAIAQAIRRGDET